MSDYGHEETDRQLAELEKRIFAEYKTAYQDISKQADDYFADFKLRDASQRALVNNGSLSPSQYKQWRLAQIGRGERFEALRNQLAKRMNEANEEALRYVNAMVPSVYCLNRNYAAYAIEQVSGDVGFTLWDENVLRRLIKEQPQLMPNYPKARAIRRGIDLDWSKRQITAQVTQSLLTGDSLKKTADRLQGSITDMNRVSAIRAARTAITGAENAGREDTYFAAQKRGLKVKKQWVATLDGRTRHSHAVIDGEIIGTNGKFSNGCRFPGDPQGRPEEVYNCRCTTAPVPDDVPDAEPVMRRVRDPVTGRNVVVNDLTYREWEAQKKQTGGFSGARKTSGWENRHAKQYYDEVRNRRPYSDARIIAENTDFDVEQIEEIRQHVFVREHFRSGGFMRFDPDFDQAQAWQRLIDGKNIRSSDIVFLNHEYSELTIMKEKGYNYEKAHDIANKTYNWVEACKKEE